MHYVCKTNWFTKFCISFNYRALNFLQRSVGKYSPKIIPISPFILCFFFIFAQSNYRTISIIETLIITYIMNRIGILFATQSLILNWGFALNKIFKQLKHHRNVLQLVRNTQHMCFKQTSVASIIIYIEVRGGNQFVCGFFMMERYYELQSTVRTRLISIQQQYHDGSRQCCYSW